MSNFQAALRALVRKTADLKEIVRELNYQIFQSANGENYITSFVALYDRTNFTLRYVNAGHTPPVIICDQEKIHLLTEGTLILGSFNPLPFLREGKMENLKNFFFFGYTDGLTETFNAEEEQFGIERLEEFLIKNYGQDLKILHETLIETLDEFNASGEHHDDITFLSLKVGDKA
jgi:sigma-B regulation protein RsbU (phosphoserine phosphatase)